MELGVAVTLAVSLCFVGLIGYKAFTKYSNLELEKTDRLAKAQETDLVNSMKVKIHELTNNLQVHKSKYRRLKNNYDIDFEDDELEELAPGAENDDVSLSELAKIVYPKLPEGLAKLIDKEEFQNAIMKTVDKKPDLITNFIDKYLNKTPDQGSDTNTTPSLKETYL